MFKFKDNYKAAAAGLFTLGAVLAVITFVFFATCGWLAAIAAILMVVGCAVSMYSNVAFEKETDAKPAQQQPAKEPAKEPAADVKVGTVVDNSAVAAVQQPGPETTVRAHA